MFSLKVPLRCWLKRICLGLLVALAIAVGTGTTYEFLARHRAARDFPPPGEMVNIGGRRIHLDCRGTGTPTVIFESGLDTLGSLGWSKVHDSVAMFTRACAYDRAGIMWSDPSSGARDAEAVAADLHKTLEIAKERAPYVMVGHSVGGLYVMTFTKIFGEDVVGMVLVDASHPDQMQKMRAAGLNLDGQMKQVEILAALSWSGLPRILWPDNNDPKAPEQIQRIAPHFASTSLTSLTAEQQALAETSREAGTIRTLNDRPLVVLTHMPPLSQPDLIALHLTKEQGQRISDIWLDLHNDESTWSSHSAHHLFTDSTHYIQFDRPDAVIAAIRNVVDRTRGVEPPPTDRPHTP
jgi:pimeloyl-ACP methyl ester carboxylesterase